MACWWNEDGNKIENLAGASSRGAPISCARAAAPQLRARSEHGGSGTHAAIFAVAADGRCGFRPDGSSRDRSFKCRARGRAVRLPELRNAGGRAGNDRRGGRRCRRRHHVGRQHCLLRVHVLGWDGANPDGFLEFWLEFWLDLWLVIAVFDAAVVLHVERNATDQLRRGPDPGDVHAAVSLAGRSFFDHPEWKGDVLGGPVEIKKAETELFAAMQTDVQSELQTEVQTEVQTMPRNRKPTERERGSTLVEFALVAVLILFPLMFGVIDFARAAYAYHYVAFAAREATRWASVRGAQCANALPAPCAATSGAGGTVDSYVRSIVPAGLYVDSSACSATSGCLLITTSWPGAPAGTNAPSACSGGAGSNSPGCAVSVEVQYTYGFDLPFLPQAAIQMASTSEMVISQ
jgi:Flp pilus assembly protein TadG